MKSRSLATRFLLVVLLGAVVPMAVVGMWLTRTSANSGRDLLVGQLTISADAVAAAITREWGTREGELQLLANNESAVRLVRDDRSSFALDTAYLAQVTTSLRSSVASVAYTDMNDRSVWSVHTATVAPRVQSESRMPAREVQIVLPVPAMGARAGTLRVGIRLESIVPSNALVRRLVGNASLIVADSVEAIWSEVADPEHLLSPRVDDSLTVVSRELPVAGLRLLVGAPVGPYVIPFRTAARDGTIALLAAAVAALLVAGVLSRRLVSSLTKLADAADRVSAGQLESSVQVTGSDEVARLGIAFNTMTQNLRQSVAELSRQRSLAAVGEFAVSLSHDVRNSLTAVRVDLQHATRHLPEHEQGTALVHRALDSVKRLDATVTSALMVARPRPDSHSTLMDEALDCAIRSARPKFLELGALLEYRAPSTPTVVHGDAGALEQMFLNLLLNAAEAVGTGSTIDVQVTQRTAFTDIAIHDRGAGMSPETLATVGRPLFTTKPNGTGLGLSIARRIAEAHGGALGIESEAGAGTTVTISLPRVEVRR